jgi:hypothetical protein
VSGDKLEVVVVVVAADDFDLPRGFFIAERAGGGGKRVCVREVVEAEEEARGRLTEWERGLCVFRWGVGAEEDMDVVVTVVGVGEDDDSRSRRCWGWGG